MCIIVNVRVDDHIRSLRGMSANETADMRKTVARSQDPKVMLSSFKLS